MAVSHRVRCAELGFQGDFLSSEFGEALSDLIKLTSCQRCGSGNLDQTGIPRLTTPFVKIQKIAPGAAF